MVGLGNVNNTSDANKPVSNATQTALNAKATLNNPQFTGTISSNKFLVDATGNLTAFSLTSNNNLTCTDVLYSGGTSLTSTIGKLATLSGPTFTGTVNGITKSMVGLSNVDNTSDVNKPVSTLQASYIYSAVANLVASAPATLDTLNELATALNNDPNFATTITTLIGTKANNTNPTISGTLTTDTITTNSKNIQVEP
jgi:hypothetical protein